MRNYNAGKNNTTSYDSVCSHHVLNTTVYFFAIQQCIQSKSVKSNFAVKDHKVVSVPSIVKVPECYVPQVIIPRVSLTEDFGDCSLPSDSSGSAEPGKDEDTDERHGGLEKDGGPEKDDNTDDENKVNIRASPIPRPRAVISSPENDHMIGNRNKIGKGRLSASKNSTVSPNRHALAQCKVKSHETTDIPPDARKCAEPKSKDKIDPVGKKKVLKGSKFLGVGNYKF
ncbi:hypothetical protein P8452_08489 [Trifolium repens]|nr:hypothetical protein P8452_08489 [Trifolium repens]